MCFLRRLFCLVALGGLVLSCTDKSITPQDNLPPSAISTLVISDRTASSVLLGWNAPGDDGNSGRASRYDIRYSTSLITESNWESAIPVSDVPRPGSPGMPQWCTVEGIDSSVAYSFAVRTADEVPNWSPLSNAALTHAYAGAPPRPIDDLRIYSLDETSVTLAWNTPAGDSAAATVAYYDIRYSTDSITEHNWFVAASKIYKPGAKSPGSPEYITIDQLQPGEIYYFGIRSMCKLSPWSALSNVVSQRTGDATPPAAIADLRAEAIGVDAIRLIWSAPGDDGSDGIASQYDLRYSTTEITAENFTAALEVTGEPLPVHPGETQSIDITGLAPVTTYYFAIRTADEVPNWSTISNLALATTLSDDDILWIRYYGGAGSEFATAVAAAPGGCVVGGKTNSSGAGGYDMYLVKTDNDGTLVWEKTFGGPADDWAADVVTVGFDGYCLAGSTESFGAGDKDACLVRTDSDGNTRWQKTYGGAGADFASAVDRTSDGGFALVGSTYSFDPSSAAYLVKTDIQGNEVWFEHYHAYSVCEEDGYAYGCDVAGTSDGRIALTAYEFNLPIAGPGGCGPPFANPYIECVDLAGGYIWASSYGLTEPVTLPVVIATDDGGFALIERDRYWVPPYTLLKTSREGLIEWEGSYTYMADAEISDLIQLDNGYIVLAGRNTEGIILIAFTADGTWVRNIVVHFSAGSDVFVVEGWNGCLYLAGTTLIDEHGLQIFLIKLRDVL